jgi:peroxiredoxin
MYPHERSLVKRLEDKPFVLVGVNSDDSRDAAKQAVAREGLTWRSFYDESAGGPIATAWGIRGWPSIFVIDAKGVIRYKDVRGKDLDRAVDRLLKEMGAAP